jgi:hypothetical protein
MKSFGSIRKNFNIPSPKTSSPKKEPVPKARRPVFNPDASPHVNRLARPPRVPEIFEEDEGGSDVLEEDGSQSPTPVPRRKKPRSTSSSSRPQLPTPTAPLPHQNLRAPIVATIHVDINESLLKQGKKRISRRQSGLINVTSSGSSGSTSSSSRSCASSPPPRPPSPAFGSPLRRSAGLVEEEEEYEAFHGQRPADTSKDTDLGHETSKGKKKRTLTQAQAEEAPTGDGHEREKRRLREDPDVAGPRLQDLTNAFGPRIPLPPLDTNISGMDSSVTIVVLLTCPQIRIATECCLIRIQICPPLRSRIALLAHRSQRPELHPRPPTFLRPATRVHHPSCLPNLIHLRWAVNAACARASITLSPSSTRAYLTFSSFLYSLQRISALCRKMRKPDPVPSLMKRTSSVSQLLQGENPRSSLEDTTASTERRRKSRPRPPLDDEESDGAQADDEPLVETRVRANLANVDMRRRSAVISASRRSLIEDDEGRRHSMLV